jgi:hypothetical protein
MPISQGYDLDGNLPTYSASAVWVAPGNAQDVFTITGSSTRIIRIKEIFFIMTATAGSNSTAKLIKRSTANTGGTSGTPVVVSFDSQFAAATAVVRNYTANPTAGTTVGDLLTRTIYVSGGGTVASVPLTLSYSPDATSPIVLRGTGEVLSVNLNGVSFGGNSCRAYVIWTEE